MVIHDLKHPTVAQKESLKVLQKQIEEIKAELDQINIKKELNEEEPEELAILIEEEPFYIVRNESSIQE